jgi:hypothetical protein
MLRRLVPAVVLGGAVVLAPDPASATPQTASVDVWHNEAYFVTAEVPIDDGQFAQLQLNRYRGSSDMSWHDDLMLSLGHPCGYSFCTDGGGSATLSDSDLHIGADLGEATLDAVPVTITSSDGGEQTVLLSATVTGSGPITRSSYGSTGCMVSDGNDCHSRRQEATRDAVGTLQLGDDTFSGTGTLFHGLGQDVEPRSSVGGYGSYLA